MKLETENVKETEASAELIRELMADDARRGNWLILMHDDDEEAFMQIATHFFDCQSASHPDEQSVMCAFTSGMGIFF